VSTPTWPPKLEALAAALISPIVTVLAVVVAFLSLRGTIDTSNKQHDLATQQQNLAVQGQITDRFNWIRVFQDTTVPMPATTPAGRLAKALANAVVQADSRGNVGQAVRILDSALARPQADDDDPVEQVEVLVYRAELAMVLHDPKTAAEMLAHVQSVVLTEEETGRAASAFDNAAELAAALR
jgi:hypothetical protein